MGGTVRHVDHPLDPSDFGRCSRLLDASWAEGWRERIGEMAQYSEEWAALAVAWPELEKLYAEEKTLDAAPKLYDAMKKARCAV